MDKTKLFRTARKTPKPMIQGPQTAIVVGPAGDEIFTDEYSRVKVQFHWDRYGKKDENSSCWVRVSTLWAGTKWGGIHIPRIGQEVVVGFLEGDPDKPLITGSVYNADCMPPYKLEANKTQSGIKSRSTKEGGPDNFNEIRMEDKSGEQELYIHAEKDQNNVVENDETTEVGHNRTEKVGNNEKINIGVNRTEDVGKNETITIGENRTETVGKDEKISITENRNEDVGKDESISIGADQTISIGNNQTEDVGKDLTLSIGGQRTTKVSSSDTLDVGSKLQVEAGDEISFTTGSASIVMKKSGDIIIKGTNITIKGSGKVDVKAASTVTIKGAQILKN
jgi:type VI secretion system secreted protein VgrG